MLPARWFIHLPARIRIFFCAALVVALAAMLIGASCSPRNENSTSPPPPPASPDDNTASNSPPTPPSSPAPTPGQKPAPKKARRPTKAAPPPQRAGEAPASRDVSAERPLDAPIMVDEAPSNYAVMRVFYATDRRPSGQLTAAKYYSGLRATSETLSQGTLDVSIPRDHHMGEIERPSIFRLEFHEDPQKHVVLLSVSPKPENQFFRELSTRVDGSAGKEAFVFVHGYDNSFEQAAWRTAQLAYDLGFDGAPILYTWPSRGTLSGYAADEATIEWTTPHLQKFLEKVAAQSHATTIHLIAHSMGNRALARALAGIAAEHSAALPMFKQVFLAAPDIDVDVFRQLAAVFPSAAGHVTLYASSRDQALAASKRFHQYARAGDSQIITIVPRVDTIDATAVDTGLLGHAYYGDNRSILSDIYSVMHTGDPPGKRFGMHPLPMPQPTYWAFQP